MPLYRYHLKIELYPTSDLTPITAENPSLPGSSAIWVPPAGASIFDDLPSHPPRHSPRKPVQQGVPLPKVEEAIELPLRGDQAKAQTGVIDCGSSRATAQDNEPNITFLSERQWRARSQSFPHPKFSAGIGPRTASKDWRFGRVSIGSFDMGDDLGVGAKPAVSVGPTLAGSAGRTVMGKYVPIETKNTEAGWGIIHLYREGDVSQGLHIPNAASSDLADGEADEEDLTTICIPAVPSYMSPGEFLGFVGEKWRGDVAHYRMVMTSSMSRYMVLMKFRDNRRAKEWREEFDGKVFSSMTEICHVTFIKSITVETPGRPENSFSELTCDPLTPSSSSSLRPFPPPTADLVELPTCTVCLERMDDTAGLMTILCQHVFHCTCLQTWKGQGCPVCRATTSSIAKTPAYDVTDPYSQPFGYSASNICSICDCTDDLWICLICGNVGCGRYKGGHAKEHWKETAHTFSLELETQHVWDYAGDMWVHRLIRDKGDGKVVELPSNTPQNSAAVQPEDVVPRAKLDNIGMEYTHLLSSQLESQRLYFEELVTKAADKAAKASVLAERASLQTQEAMRKLGVLEREHKTLKNETVPGLERDLERERSRAAKATELARKLGGSLQEEKKVGEGLMARIEHVNKEIEAIRLQNMGLAAKVEELEDTNRDLSMFISGQEKLKELEEEGKVKQDEIQDGAVSVPEAKQKGKGKGKARK